MELEKVTIRLYKGDSAALNAYYTQAGYNRAIRELVRTHLKLLHSRESHARGTAVNLELTPSDIPALAGTDAG